MMTGMLMQLQGTLHHSSLMTTGEDAERQQAVSSGLHTLSSGMDDVHWAISCAAFSIAL